MSPWVCFYWVETVMVMIMFGRSQYCPGQGQVYKGLQTWFTDLGRANSPRNKIMLLWKIPVQSNKEVLSIRCTYTLINSFALLYLRWAISVKITSRWHIISGAKNFQTHGCPFTNHYNMVRWISAPGTMHFRPRYDTFWPCGLFTLLQFCKHPPPPPISMKLRWITSVN